MVRVIDFWESRKDDSGLQALATKPLSSISVTHSVERHIGLPKVVV